MTVPARKSSKLLDVGWIYFLAILLVQGLFYLHTVLIFDVAGALLGAQPWLLERFEPHEASKMIVLGCFVILFFAHLLDVGAWSLFLRWSKLMPTFLDGLYFIGTSISTLGYGDVVLARPWRHIGPMVAIAGVLKFGCSTAFLFFVIQQVWMSQL